jgi:hypothetical protein
VELLGDEESMKKRIDEGILVETETIDLIQPFTQPGQDGSGFVGWVRIERSGGRGEIHVCCGPAVTTEAEARRLAIARADAMSAEVLTEPPTH